MTIEVPALPYAMDALEPYISAQTLEFHYGKHHRGYADKLNAGILGTAYEHEPLETIIAAANEAGDSGIFNNAAQVWNHSFLWNSMAPNGSDNPAEALATALITRFGGIAEFRAAFKEAALGQFGSGWVWLVRTHDGLDIQTTGNADTPLISGVLPLLTLDVWEHAYYLDYQNKRGAYIDAFLSNLINWEFASWNYESDRVAA